MTEKERALEALVKRVVELCHACGASAWEVESYAWNGSRPFCRGGAPDRHRPEPEKVPDMIQAVLSALKEVAP